MAIATDVLNLARSQLGVCENPMGSNSGTPYHAWYGSYCQGWQWCAIFVTWVIWHIDQALCWGLYTAYSGDYLNVGRMHLREIGIENIQPGDICIWDRPVGGITDHIGFVESATPTTFTTLEGNSGDGVRRNTHDRIQTSSCHYYFVRPNYSAAPPPEEEDTMNTVPLEVVVMPPGEGTYKWNIPESMTAWKWAKELEEWLIIYNENPAGTPPVKVACHLISGSNNGKAVDLPAVPGWSRIAVKISDLAKGQGINGGFAIALEAPSNNLAISATLFMR